MAKKKTEIRSVRINCSFSPTEIELIDKYCNRLKMTRSEFVAASCCIALESDLVMKIVANVMVPTIDGVKVAIKAVRADNPGLVV